MTSECFGEITDLKGRRDVANARMKLDPESRALNYDYSPDEREIGFSYVDMTVRASASLHQ
jgi:hypothetical protein